MPLKVGFSRFSHIADNTTRTPTPVDVLGLLSDNFLLFRGRGRSGATPASAPLPCCCCFLSPRPVPATWATPQVAPPTARRSRRDAAAGSAAWLGRASSPEGRTARLRSGLRRPARVARRVSGNPPASSGSQRTRSESPGATKPAFTTSAQSRTSRGLPRAAEAYLSRPPAGPLGPAPAPPSWGRRGRASRRRA